MNFQVQLATSCAVAVFLFINSESQAASWIDGYKYPDGCQKVFNTVNGVEYSGIQCPKVGEIKSIEQAKRAEPLSFGGFPSTNVSQQPAAQDPARCRAAQARMGDNLAHFLTWLRLSMYGTPEYRVLTRVAASSLHDRLRSWGMRAMNRGISIFRHRKRGEDGNQMCVNHVDGANVELTRVIDLVKSEARKGNRDLTDTGLNPYESVYND